MSDEVGIVDSILHIDSQGNKFWLNAQGQKHRIGGPAIEWFNGDKVWRVNGKHHREDGPAVEGINGDKYWYIHDKLHRLDGPAIDSIEVKEWFINGERHREGGPAIEWDSGLKKWYLNGKCHRLEGPAIEWNDRDKQWWYQGMQIDCNSQEEFERIIKLLGFV